MNYATKFSLGDQVWTVRHDNFQRIVKCKPCANTGKVVIGEEKLVCPKCHGRSTHTQYAGEKFYVSDFAAIVGQVRVEHTDDAYVSSYREDEPQPKIEYMLNATGVCTGQVWKEDALFGSEAEARAFCDLKNGLLPAHETEHGKDVIGRFGEVLGGAA